MSKQVTRYCDWIVIIEYIIIYYIILYPLFTGVVELNSEWLTIKKELKQSEPYNSDWHNLKYQIEYTSTNIPTENSTSINLIR